MLDILADLFRSRVGLLALSREGAAYPLSAAPLPETPPYHSGNSEFVVNGATQPLLAAQIPFGRLNRDVPEQELNLVEFAAGEVA